MTQTIMTAAGATDNVRSRRLDRWRNVRFCNECVIYEIELLRELCRLP